MKTAADDKSCETLVTSTLWPAELAFPSEASESIANEGTTRTWNRLGPSTLYTSTADTFESRYLATTSRRRHLTFQRHRRDWWQESECMRGMPGLARTRVRVRSD